MPGAVVTASDSWLGLLRRETQIREQVGEVVRQHLFWQREVTHYLLRVLYPRREIPAAACAPSSAGLAHVQALVNRRPLDGMATGSVADLIAVHLQIEFLARKFTTRGRAEPLVLHGRSLRSRTFPFAENARGLPPALRVTASRSPLTRLVYPELFLDASDWPLVAAALPDLLTPGDAWVSAIARSFLAGVLAVSSGDDRFRLPAEVLPALIAPTTGAAGETLRRHLVGLWVQSALSEVYPTVANAPRRRHERLVDAACERIRAALGCGKGDKRRLGALPGQMVGPLRRLFDPKGIDEDQAAWFPGAPIESSAGLVGALANEIAAEVVVVEEREEIQVEREETYTEETYTEGGY